MLSPQNRYHGRMKRYMVLRAVVCAVVLMAMAPVFAAKTAISGLFRFTLDNGLELFVMENDAVPLAYIEIAVRAGGVTQQPETAGLFHLYEHMMFKGNALYENQAAVTDAINKLGVADWNGTTGIDRVNYFFTVPSALLRAGLEFWSYAVRTPLLDERELENEKGVVLSEIGAHDYDPGHIVAAALCAHLFAESPWKLDSGGMPQTVADATVEQLRAIQRQYYVPNNAALFVGGNVKAANVHKLVKELYGDWERGAPVPAVTPPTKTPFGKRGAVSAAGGTTEPCRLVYANPALNGSYVQAELCLRGPDGETDAADTYAADVWAGMVEHPESSFMRILLSDAQLGISDPDYLSGFYLTRRAAGIIGLSVLMHNGGSPVAQAERFFGDVIEQCIPTFTDDGAFLTAQAISGAKRLMADGRIYSLETAEGLLSSLSAVWASCGADYFLGYDDSIAAVTADDIRGFVRRYLDGVHGVQLVTVSVDVYQENKALFEQAGYREITAENAFWWKKSEE